jgi:sugar porter (SP) family MFS transporter
VSVLVPLYQSEMSPKWIRGTLVCAYQLAITFGLLIAALVNNFTSAIDSSASYRVSISIQFFWAFILFLGLCLLPETPRYLIKTNQHAKAALSLSRLRRLDITHPALIEELAEIEANHAYELSLGPSKYIDCFTGSPHLGRRLLTGSGLQMLQQLSGCNFIFYYGTTFFEKSKISSPFIISLITNIANVLSTFLALSLVESWGRRRLLMIGATGMAVCLFVVASVGTAVPEQKTANIVLVVFVCTFIFFFASSWGPVVWVVTSEIFPLKVRAKSMSIATASNWLLNWGLAYSTPYLVGEGSGYANLKGEIFFVWGGSSLVAIFFVWAMVFETSKISLEQIDELYERVDRAWLSSNFQPSWSFQDIRDESQGVSGGATGVALQEREREEARRRTGVGSMDGDSERGSSSGSALSTQQSHEPDDKIFPMANVDFTI